MIINIYNNNILLITFLLLLNHCTDLLKIFLKYCVLFIAYKVSLCLHVSESRKSLEKGMSVKTIGPKFRKHCSLSRKNITKTKSICV